MARHREIVRDHILDNDSGLLKMLFHREVTVLRPCNRAQVAAVPCEL